MDLLQNIRIFCKSGKPCYQILKNRSMFIYNTKVDLKNLKCRKANCNIDSAMPVL